MASICRAAYGVCSSDENYNAYRTLYAMSARTGSVILVEDLQPSWRSQAEPGTQLGMAKDGIARGTSGRARSLQH